MGRKSCKIYSVINENEKKFLINTPEVYGKLSKEFLKKQLSFFFKFLL